MKKNEALMQATTQRDLENVLSERSQVQGPRVALVPVCEIDPELANPDSEVSGGSGNEDWLPLECRVSFEVVTMSSNWVVESVAHVVSVLSVPVDTRVCSTTRAHE